MITLYQRESCPYCAPVRQLLTDLGITYLNANVVKPRENRRELIDATRSPFIPAIVDGETVIPGKLEDNSDVIAYITAKYGASPSPTPTCSPDEDGQCASP